MLYRSIVLSIHLTVLYTTRFTNLDSWDPSVSFTIYCIYVSPAVQFQYSDCSQYSF